MKIYKFNTGIWWKWWYSTTATMIRVLQSATSAHDEVIRLKRFPHYWTFVGESNSHQWIPQTKGQQYRTLMFYLLEDKAVEQTAKLYCHCQWFENPWWSCDMRVFSSKYTCFSEQHSHKCKYRCRNTWSCLLSKRKGNIEHGDLGETVNCY